MHFWRPLSSALIALQYAVFGEHAAAFHGVSLLIQIALILAVAALFRRVLPTLWPISLLLFAIDAHWDAVGWIAANNSMLALLVTVFRAARVSTLPRAIMEAWARVGAARDGADSSRGEPRVGALAYIGRTSLWERCLQARWLRFEVSYWVPRSGQRAAGVFRERGAAGAGAVWQSRARRAARALVEVERGSFDVRPFTIGPCLSTTNARISLPRTKE
jgi:hypothetical protein